MDEKENFRTKKVWPILMSISGRLTVCGSTKYYRDSFAKIIEWAIEEELNGKN